MTNHPISCSLEIGKVLFRVGASVFGFVTMLAAAFVVPAWVIYDVLGWPINGALGFVVYMPTTVSLVVVSTVGWVMFLERYRSQR